jgi:DNA-binding response OmpR family regulator
MRISRELVPYLILLSRLITAQLLSHFVKKSNYAYNTAVNGLKALQAFQDAEKPYDIVIMGKSPPVQLIYFRQPVP